jgi:hypothetical protein
VCPDHPNQEARAGLFGLRPGLALSAAVCFVVCAPWPSADAPITHFPLSRGLPSEECCLRVAPAHSRSTLF